MEARLASWEFTFHYGAGRRGEVCGGLYPVFARNFMLWKWYSTRRDVYSILIMQHFNIFPAGRSWNFLFFSVSPELTAKRSLVIVSILFINTHLSTRFRCCFCYLFIHFFLSFPTVFISFWWLWKMRHLNTHTLTALLWIFLLWVNK